MRFEEVIAFERKDAAQEASAKTMKNTMIQNTLDLLEDYGNIPDSLRQKLEATDDIDLLKKYHKLAAKAESMEAFEKQLP